MCAQLLTAAGYRTLAEQAGYVTVPLLYADGCWCDDDDDDADPEYSPSHRKAQLDVAHARPNLGPHPPGRR